MSNLTVVILLVLIQASGQSKRQTQDACEDIVDIKDCDYGGKLKFFRFKPNQLVAHFETKCKFDAIKYIWQVTDSSQHNPVIDLETDNVFVMPPFTLRKGFNAFSIEALVTRGANKVSIHGGCEVEVESLDPIATIDGGTEVTVEADQKFTLDGSKSIDRDASINATKTLVYKWTCQVTEGKVTDFCQKNYQGSRLEVPSTYAITNYIYVFTLSVRNQDSNQWITSLQTVTILKNVAILEIICEKNCPPAAPTTDGKRLTFLRVKCLKNCGQISDSSYEWTVQEDFNYDKTQFGRNTDKFVIKVGTLENGKNYTVRVKLKNRIGTAGKVLQVPSPLKIESCEVKPKEGVAIETKFGISCKYSGIGYLFEVLTKDKEQNVVLTENYILENVKFILPTHSQVFMKITDINGFQDIYKLDVKVQSSSKQLPSVLASIEDSITRGDSDSAIQTINAIVDQVSKSQTKSLLQYLDHIPMKSQTNARQVASIVSKLVNDPNAKSDPYQGEMATTICKKASEIDLQYMKQEYYPTIMTSEAQESAKTLMSCGETDSKENFQTLKPAVMEFNVTTPFPVLDVPVIEENYPDYSDDESVVVKRDKYDTTTQNVVDICENSLQMLNLTVVEGESTVVATTNSTATQITRLVGEELSKTEIEVQGGIFRASGDFVKIKETIDVMICSWGYDPFWWNPAKMIVSTNVLLIKLIRNGKEEKKFLKPNEIVLDLREQQVRSKEVEFGTSVRIDVKKHESFLIQFHNMSDVDSFKALVTNFEKPEEDRVNREGKRVTISENMLFQEERNGYDSWYYLTLGSEKVTNRSKVWISVVTKSCYFWDFSKKKWSFACQGGSHTNDEKMQCFCDHFSILAGVVYNNRFKVDRVETELDFEMVLIRSLIIYITASIIFFIYCILIAITISSKRNIKIVYLPADISSSSRFAYLICIQTGPKSSSSTTSNICVRIHGDKSKSKSHVLNYPDPQMKIFQKNHTDWFLLPTEHHLGNVLEVVLWSDFSGRHPRWFCSHVVVYDLQTDNEWYFKVDSWFDLPPTGQILQKFATSEKEKKSRRFTMRLFPKRSHQQGFSSLRKLTLILSILLTTLVSCLLIYGLPTLTLKDGFGTAEEYEFDPIVILIGFVSSIITFSSHIILIFAFRYKNGNQISWFLLVGNVIASITVLVIYGFWVPQVTGYSWLSSVLISILFYFFLWENLYDLLANFHQLKPIVLEKDVKEHLPPIEKQRIRLFEIFGEDLLRPYFEHLYRPMDDDDIKERKRRIEIKNRLFALLEDTIMFVCYVTLLYLAIFANRNSMSIRNHQQVVQLLSGSHTRTMEYSDIESIDGLYEYINETLIPTLHGHQWYSHFVVKEPGLMLDFHNKFLGVARLRQKRVIFKSCQGPWLIEPNSTCRAEFWDSEESTVRFAPGNGTLARLSRIWNYTSSRLAGISVYVGKFGIYHGGGFVAPLGRTWHNSLANLLYLKNHSWIDDKSSVIIVEFLTYNVNTNLFNAVKIIVERSTTGYFRSRLYLNTAQFLFVNSEAKTIHLVIFLSFVLVVGIFTFKFLVRIFKGKLLIWTDLWTFVDLIIVGLSAACFGVFVHRAETVKEFLDKVETIKKNEFINYFNLLYEDSTFTLVAAFLVFVATVRLWKVCRFGTIFKIMEKTILFSIGPMSLIFFYHMIIILAYGFSGLVLFGTISTHFRDIPDTVLTLLLLLMGMHNEFDVNEILDLNSYLAKVYYFSYMFVTMFFLTIYVCVIMLCYYEAQITFNEESAKIVQFLYKEYKFYKTSARVVLRRLRGGTQKKSVTPKEDDLRYADCKTLESNALEFMRLVAIYKLKKFRMTEDEKLVVMKNVAKCCVEDGEIEIFFSGDDDGMRVFHDDRMRKVAAAAEMILGYDYKKKERLEKKYRRVIEKGLAQLDFVNRLLETVSRIVGNIQIE